MTRQEHLDFAKTRALDLLHQGRLTQAIVILAAELLKREDLWPLKLIAEEVEEAIFFRIPGGFVQVEAWIRRFE